MLTFTRTAMASSLVVDGVTIDFDWGECGEPDGFDTWRLWLFARLNPSVVVCPEHAQVREWIEEAAAAGELVQDRYLYYSSHHRARRQRVNQRLKQSWRCQRWFASIRQRELKRYCERWGPSRYSRVSGSLAPQRRRAEPLAKKNPDGVLSQNPSRVNAHVLSVAVTVFVVLWLMGVIGVRMRSTASVSRPDKRVPVAGVKARLIVLRVGLRPNWEYRIFQGRNVIGRADQQPVDIDLQPQEPGARWSSRQHAAITCDGGSMVIEDP